MLTEKLAHQLKDLRLAQSWSLDQLATQSGISRATLSRLEKADVSPTAEVMGKLCAAYGLPMSRLLMMIEDQFTPHIRSEDQQIWEDPETGFTRRSVSPLASPLNGEVLDCQLPPDTCISYAAAPRTGQEHHLIMLNGALSLTVDGTVHHLKNGDCLRYILTGASQFKTAPDLGARYMLVLI